MEDRRRGISLRSAKLSDREAPGRPGQECLFVRDALPGGGAVELEESLLDDVVGILHVSKNRIGDAEDEAGLPSYQGCEPLVARGCGFPKRELSGDPTIPTPAYTS